MNFILHPMLYMKLVMEEEGITIKKEGRGRRRRSRILFQPIKRLFGHPHVMQSSATHNHCHHIYDMQRRHFVYDGVVLDTSRTCVLSRITTMYPPLHYHRLSRTTWNCVVWICKKKPLLQMLT